MTNNDERFERLLAIGYSTREATEQLEFEAKPNFFANATCFIIESINEGHFLRDIEELDEESFEEFAVYGNFDRESFSKAADAFRKASFQEVTGTR